MKRVIIVILALSMLLAIMCGCGNSSAPASSGDSNKVYEAKFATQEIETTFNSRIAVELWAEKVEAATDGRVKFVYYWSNSLCDVRDLLDNAESGAVDAFWAATSAFVGRYVAYLGLTLPGLGLITSADGAEAMWNWLQQEECAKERGTAVLVACYPTGDMTINNSKGEIKTAADFNGLRLRALNSAWQAVYGELGIVPLSFNLPDTYENISKNVCDGLVLDFNYLFFNRIYEVSKYNFDASFSNNVGTIYLSPVFLDSLPDDLREIVLSCGGVELCREAGDYMASKLEGLKKGWVEEGGVLYPVSDEVNAALENAFKAGVANWIEECDGKGYNGQELYDRLISVTGPYFGK